MFRPSSEAPLLTEAGVLGLCASLNSPVLNIEQLPVGPARAAILLFAGEYGGVRIAVGLRSVETGVVAHFAYSGSAEDFDAPDRAMDAALTFAEALGFLFDEDVVGGAGRSEALRLWQELTGESGDADGVDAATGTEADEPGFELELELDPEGGGELLLDDLAAGALPLDDGSALVELEVLPQSRPVRSRSQAGDRKSPAPVAAEPAPVGAGRSEAPPGRTAATLTKFRASAPAPDGAADTTGGSHLGRIALVRRRVGNETTGADRPSLLMRILSAF
jgi:hypothetical protein